MSAAGCETGSDSMHINRVYLKVFEVSAAEYKTVALTPSSSIGPTCRYSSFIFITTIFGHAENPISWVRLRQRSPLAVRERADAPLCNVRVLLTATTEQRRG